MRIEKVQRISMLRKIWFIPISILILLTLARAQSALLKSYKINYNDTTAYYGLGSNGVSQIQPEGDSILWLGTGAGLSWLEKSHYPDSLFSYYPGFEAMPKGAISAIETSGDRIWVAGVFDSTTSEGDIQTGGGLAYSDNGGKNWTKIAQPIDGKDDKYDIWNGDTIRFSPVRTPVQNTTWDIAIDDENVYIVSWAAGLRRTSDNGQTWHRIPLPGDAEDTLVIGQDGMDYPVDPLDNQNQMGFSVIANNDTLWVGTARGINKGIIQGNKIKWIHYSAQQIRGLSGDFVVALYRQQFQGQETIWAATLTGGTAGETRGICYTQDGGRTWHTTMKNYRGYDITSIDNDVYVGTQSGLFKLSENREEWSEFRQIFDDQTKDEVLSDDIYALYADSDYLWVGTGDGIARYDYRQQNWRTYHHSISTQNEGEPAIYAYPNPFYPNRHNYKNGDGHVRIKFDLQSSATVWLEVYDFAMDQVYKGPREHFQAGDKFVIWNGRMDNNELVANGAYFCKLTRKTESGTKSHWTKLLIMK